MPRTVSDLARRWLAPEDEALSDAESRVLQSALDRRPIARNVNQEHSAAQSTGDRIADAIARVGGSWSFILTFIVFLIVWTIGGGLLLASKSFDPYPFIFLNLILSMIAALQAPVIMMSQNRQSEHDRMDAAHDYEVNLKAEIEIMALHEKLDEMRRLEIVKLQSNIAELAAQLKRIEARMESTGNA